jgi:signal peptidase I
MDQIQHSKKIGNLKKRRPVIAFLLSLVTPGLGQMYNGKLKRGIVFFGVYEILLILLYVFSGLRYEFRGLVLFIAFIVILLGFFIYVLLDAIFNINKLRVTVLKPYHKWYLYVGIFAAVLIINEVILDPILPDIKSFKSYKMSSSSMAPALLIGDRLIVDMKVYKDEKPRRGDMIIFEFPKDPSKDYLKRVVGLEGEKIEIINNKVHIDEKLMDDPWGYFKSSAEETHFEKLENFGPEFVPEGALFVLGDNRDNSLDSRFFGFVELTKIKGKALYIYWAKDKGRIGMKIK